MMLVLLYDFYFYLKFMILLVCHIILFYKLFQQVQSQMSGQPKKKGKKAKSMSQCSDKSMPQTRTRTPTPTPNPPRGYVIRICFVIVHLFCGFVTLAASSIGGTNSITIFGRISL